MTSICGATSSASTAKSCLGAPEHDGSRSRPIDYERWPLYRGLACCRSRGAVRAFCFGVGLDALTLAATIPTVVVIDEHAFEELFGSIVEANAEGIIVTNNPDSAVPGDSLGIPFDAENVKSFLRSKPMAPPGAACLALAWRHRDLLSHDNGGRQAGVTGEPTTTDQALRPTSAERDAAQRRWLETRAYLNLHRYQLTQTAQDLYPSSWRVAGTPLLARPEWLPTTPIRLDRVGLSWRVRLGQPWHHRYRAAVRGRPPATRRRNAVPRPTPRPSASTPTETVRRPSLLPDHRRQHRLGPGRPRIDPTAPTSTSSTCVRPSSTNTRLRLSLQGVPTCSSIAELPL